ncbi:hypothetical protein OZ410_00055 [Robiginitalea sp. M366]|uniref:hypothetical protein n=1 Tax=Robiginitalea aestuariiviva TaxID=3036903 RepID=UPI00240CF8C1|nr:hypothetical protein [Robiginitalea aestuariiviva]MDG1570692.1 hypothetical protein [Robiginitalea aestuariiviva]
MGGEGSMLHAIKSMKQNRALLKKRRKGNRSDYIGDGATPLSFKEVSPEELARIKAGIRSRAARERRREWLLWGVLVVLTTLGLLWLFGG